MTFHSSQTFTYGEQPSASKWQYIWDNDEALRDGTGFLPNVITPATWANDYAFSVYRNAAANTGNNTWATISYDTEVYDVNGDFSAGGYTVPVDGIYHFSARFSATTSSTNQQIIPAIAVNGTRQNVGNRIIVPTSGAIAGVSIDIDISLAAGDVVTVQAYGSLALALEVGVSSTCYFMGHLVSPT